MARNTGAWITTEEHPTARDDRGRPINRYVVSWYEIARDDNGIPLPQKADAPNGPPKLKRCGGNLANTFGNFDDAKARADEINPKLSRGLSPAIQQQAGNRPLNYFATAYFDGCEGNVKPRTLAGYRDNYRRYIAIPLGDKAVASITAADVRVSR